jgi:hypothetical protein
MSRIHCRARFHCRAFSLGFAVLFLFLCAVCPFCRAVVIAVRFLFSLLFAVREHTAMDGCMAAAGFP